MDLWPAYEKEARKETFGEERLTLETGKRWHTSLAMVEERSRELELNKAFFQGYSEEKRYVIAREITYDFFMSIYDVNTTQAILLRPSQRMADAALKRVTDEIRRKRLKNLEIRLIGLQRRDPMMPDAIWKIHTRVPGRLIEVDLFGNMTRHIALDLKTGSSYDLLLQNRIYRPAELINNTQVADFQSRKSEITFV